MHRDSHLLGVKGSAFIFGFSGMGPWYMEYDFYTPHQPLLLITDLIVALSHNSVLFHFLFSYLLLYLLSQ